MPRFDHVPQWSPDGTKITFQSHVGPSKDEIYVMNADGSVQTPLTNDTNYDWGPTWSPDGTKIAFESVRNNRRQIFTINPDGTGQTQLTSGSNGSSSPVWSPDGKRIGYSDNISSPGINTPELWAMNRDGTGKTRLTTDSLAHYAINWQRVQPAVRVDDLTVSETAGIATVTLRSDNHRHCRSPSSTRQPTAARRPGLTTRA